MTFDSREDDYYNILNIASNADQEEIRRAFRQMARQHHPDVSGDDTGEMMRRLNQAYSILSDPEKRRQYDEERQFHFQASIPFSHRHQQSMDFFMSQMRASSSYKPPITARGPYALVRRNMSHHGPIVAFGLAQTGEIIGIGSSDGYIELIHMTAREKLCELHLGIQGRTQVPGNMQALRLSPKGTYALGWGFQLDMKVWNVLSGQLIWQSRNTAPIGAIDGMVTDTGMMRLVLPLADNSPLVDPFDWSKIGGQGTDVQTIVLTANYTMQTPAHMQCYEPVHGQNRQSNTVAVNMRTISLDGSYFLSFSTGPLSNTIKQANIFHRWNILAGNKPHIESQVALPRQILWYPIATSADVSIIATQFEERFMRVYDMTTGLFTDIPTGSIHAQSHVSLSSDGSLLLVSPYSSNIVKLWSTATGELIQEWVFPSRVSALRFASYGSAPAVLIGRQDGNSEFWVRR